MADRLLFPPTTAEDMKARGWDAPDFVYVNGDAYVDHPSFGAAIITRTLEAAGYRVAVLAQRMADAGLTPGGNELSPNYLRLSQAERERAEKMQNS